jgi:hypothetical protein
MGISVKPPSTQSATGAASITFNAPSQVTNTDVLILCLVWNNQQLTGSWSAPSGWASMFLPVTYNVGHRSIQFWIKTAGNSEPATYQFSNSAGSGDVAGTIVDLAGATITGLVTGTGNSGNSATASANGLTATSANGCLVACFADSSNTNTLTPQASMTSQGGTVGGGTTLAECAATEIVASGATGARTASLTSDQWGAIQVWIPVAANVSGKEPRNIVSLPPPQQAHFE